jgi:putative hydrolase of the HAD superfamily
MAIKAVFFDAAGTLIKPARRVGESYAMIARRYGLAIGPAELSERFRACFDASPPLAFPGVTEERMTEMEREWWKDLVLRVLGPAAAFERFDEYFSDLFAYFAGPAAWALYPEVPETVSALRERGLILDVISNFDSRLISILHGLGAAGWFSNIFVSTRVGYAKPDRRIFEAALRQHGLEPHEALHIGDSMTNDFRGASDAGLRAVLVDRGINASPSTPACVGSLDEVLPLLAD